MKKLFYVVLLLLVANLVTYCTKSEDLTLKQSETQLPADQAAAERANCTTGDCNWTVEIVSVSPSGALWGMDINRYLCDFQRCECDIFDCESAYNSGSNSLGVQYSFPVEHVSRLAMYANLYNSSATLISGTMTVKLKKPAPLNTVYTYTLTSGALTPVNVSGVCPNLTIPGCSNGGGDGE